MTQTVKGSSTFSWDWIQIPAGEFQMGSNDFYPEERPVVTRSVGAFWVASTPVTNADFRRFVEDTGYVTVAERSSLGLSDPGSLVFQPSIGPVDLSNWSAWWRWQPGAQWRHPYGPNSDIEAAETHPVVQICYEDAQAFCSWAGCRLPTEIEHEYAACGGRVPAPFAWGTERFPDGKVMANTWHGLFPYDNQGASGWRGTSPVGSFPPNDFGLFDMIGNVWEWTSTLYQPNHEEVSANCCSPSRSTSDDQRVLKGGSHLCAPEYCLRYRPAARSPQAEDSAATHIGMRCVLVETVC